MPNQGIKIDISAQIVGYLASLKKLKLMAANIDLGSSLGKNVSAAIKSAEKELAVLQKNPIQTAKSLGQIEGVLNKANRVGLAIQNIGTMMQSVTGSSLNLQALGAEFTKLASDIDGLQTKLNQSMDLGIQDAIKNSAELQAAFQALGVSTDKITAKKGGDILASGLEKARSLALKLTTQYENMQATILSRQSQMESKYKNNPFVSGTFDTDTFSKQINEILNPKQIVDGSKILELKQRLIEQLTNLKIPNDQFSKFQDEINRLLVPDIKPDQVASALAQITKLFSQGLGEKGVGSGIQKRIYGGTLQLVLKSIMGIDVNDLETAKQQLQAKLTLIQDGLQPKDIAHIKTLIDTGSIQLAKIATIKAMHDANLQVKDNYKKDLELIENLRQKIATLEVQKNEAVQKFTTIQTGSQNYSEVIASLQKQLQLITAEKQRLLQELKVKLEQQAGNIKLGASDVADIAAQLNLGADAAARYGTLLLRVQSRLQMVGKIQGVVQRWFSIYAAVRMVSNAIREVNSTIQLLDTTITEIAIVTDMSHSDLWGQMDDYVDLADKYAASISGVYKVSQLYYQQGLQQTDVMALTLQTLKMARISGLDYLAATNYMTNAVRSFKMLMTDAQQVVDAYSAVAASSATSVSELATAMSKTASSAQAVGSSFQNTTAMMAVMILATRESAENIGSAMKSIISRYGEMTSDPSAMKDSEGLEMSLNRVDKALKSVGISMQTALGQFRDFDDVIMELASKWDTLDTNTQRYIATIMAGNRQQSRFLALVSSYDRLKELTLTANDSEDASQLQYLKTLDSVDAKILRVQNSLKSLYLESGWENARKSWLDFLNNLIKTLGEMPKWADQPVLAIAKIGTSFYALASIVTNAFKLIKANLLQQRTEFTALQKLSMGETLSTALKEAANRVLQKQRLGQALVEQERQNNANLRAVQKDGTAQRLADQRSAAQAYLASQRRMTMGGMAATAIGLGFTTVASQVSSKNNGLKGTLTGVGAIASGIGVAAMGGFNPASILMGIATALPGLFEAINLFSKSALERIKLLKLLAEQANNEALKKRNETKSLADQISSLRKLEEARYDSILAEKEYYLAAGKLAETYPNLITSMDLAGNVAISLRGAELELNQVRQESIAAAKEAAAAQYELMLLQRRQALEAAREGLKGLVSVNTPYSRQSAFAADTYSLRFSSISPNLKESQIAFLRKIGIFNDSNQLSDDAYRHINQYVARNGVYELSSDFWQYMMNQMEEVFGSEDIDSFNMLNDIGDILFDNWDGFLSSALLKQGFNPTSLSRSYGKTVPELKRAIDDMLLMGSEELPKELIGTLSEISELLSSEDRTDQIKGLQKISLLRFLGAFNELDSTFVDYISNTSNALLNVYSLLLKSQNLILSTARSGIAQVVGNSLIGVKDTTLEGFTGILSIMTEQLIAALEKQYGADGVVSAEEYKTFLNNNLPTLLKEYQGEWKVFWNNLTSSQRNNFNSIIKKVKTLSRSLFIKALTEDAGFSADNANMIADLYYREAYSFGSRDDTNEASFINRYKNKKNYSSAREGTLLGTIRSQIELRLNNFLENLGSNELIAINDFYDKLLQLINNGTITLELGSGLLTQYLKLGETLSKISDPVKKLSAEAFLYNWDGTLGGLYQLKDNLDNLGIEYGDSLDILIENFPVNLTSEFNSYIKNISKKIKTLKDILSKAEKGMEFDEALQLALQLDLSLKDDFYIIGDKFYIKNIEAVQKEYDTYEKNLILALDEKAQRLMTVYTENIPNIIGNFDNNPLKDIKITRINEKGETEEISWKSADLESKINYLTKEFNIQKLDAIVLILGIDQYYLDWLNWLDTLEGKNSTDRSFEHFLNLQLEKIKLNAQVADDLLYYQLASYAIKTGNINGFLEMIKESVQVKDLDWLQTKNRLLSQIASGDFSSIPQQYVKELWNYYTSLNKDVYLAAIKSLNGEGKQLVEVTKDNFLLLKELGARDVNGGEITLNTTQAWLDLADATTKQITLLQNSIIDSSLSSATKKSLLSQLHKSKYSTKISNTFGNLASNYRLIEYDTLLSIALSLGMKINQLITDYGLSLNEATGKYSMSAEDALKMAGTMLFYKQADKKTYNSWVAQIRKTQRLESLNNIMQDIIPKRNELVLEDIQSLADILGTTYDDILSKLIRNSDGTYKMSLATIEKVMGKKLSDLPQKLLELVGEQIDNIIGNLTGMVSDQSKGFTSIKSMQEYVTRIKDLGITQINGKDINLQALFEWNDALHAFVLTQEGIISQAIAAKALLSSLDVGSDLYIAVQKFLKDTERQFAEQIDVSSLMILGQTTSERLRAWDNFLQAINNYNAFLKGIELTGRLLNASLIKKNIQGGGVLAVKTAKYLARLSGKTLSRDDILSFYQAQISPWLAAAELILSGPGSIISGQAADALRYADAASVQYLTDGQYLVASTVDLAKAYHYIYLQMIATNEATLADLNNIKALLLLAATGANVVEALGSAALMTYTQFGLILTKQGIMLTDDLIKKLLSEGTLQQIGGGKIRISNFARFADLMGWLQSSELYISALKTYNQAMVDLNNKMTRNIGEEVEGLSDLTGGEWLDVTDLWSELRQKESTYISLREQFLIDNIKTLSLKAPTKIVRDKLSLYSKELLYWQSIPGSIKQLNDQLKQYGGYVLNGILKTVDDANILGIMQTIYNVAALAGIMLQLDLALLADAIGEMLKGFADNISAGLEGTLTNTTKLQLQKFAKANLNFELKLSDFSQTTTGLKLSVDAATRLYSKLKEIDMVAAKITFDSLRESLLQVGLDCEDISKTMATIASLLKQLQNNPDNTRLRERLQLYKLIAIAQMQLALQYDFMNKKIPDYLQGPVNFMNSTGKAFKAMNEASQMTYYDNTTGQKITSTKPEDLANATGYKVMAIDDFVNIVTEMGNLAQMTGKPLMFFGNEIYDNTLAVSRLINAGFLNMMNIDGLGAVVNIGSIAFKFKSLSEEASMTFDEGVKAFAQTQKNIVDSMISVLLTIVAMLKIKEIDTNGDITISMPLLYITDKDGKIADPNDIKYEKQVKTFAQAMVDKANESTELGKKFKLALMTYKINGISLWEMFNDATDGQADLVQEGKISALNLLKAWNGILKLVTSEGYDPNDWSSFLNIMKDAGLEGEYLVNGVKMAIKYGLMLLKSLKGYEVNGTTYDSADEAMLAYNLSQTNKLIKVTKVETNEQGKIEATGTLQLTTLEQIQVTSVEGEIKYWYNGTSHDSPRDILDIMYDLYKNKEINKTIQKALEEENKKLSWEEAEAQTVFMTKLQWMAQVNVPIEFTSNVIAKNEEDFKKATHDQILQAQKLFIKYATEQTQENYNALVEVTSNMGITLDLNPEVAMTLALYQSIAQMLGLLTKTVDLTLITHILGDDAGVLDQLVKQGKITGKLLLTPEKITLSEGNDISLDTINASLKELILTSTDNVNWDAVNALMLSVPLDKWPTAQAFVKLYIVTRIGGLLGLGITYENFPTYLTNLQGLPTPILQAMCTSLEITWGGNSATNGTNLKQEDIQKLADELELDSVAVKAIATSLIITNGGVLNDVQLETSLRVLLNLLQSGGYTDQLQQNIALKFFASTIILSQGSGTKVLPDNSITNASFKLGNLDGTTAIGTLLKLILNVDSNTQYGPEGGLVIPEQVIKLAEGTIQLLKATFTATEGENPNYSVSEITGIKAAIDVVLGVIKQIKAVPKDGGAITHEQLQDIVRGLVERVYGTDNPLEVLQVTADVMKIILGGGGKDNVIIPDGVVPPLVLSGKTVIVKAEAQVLLTNELKAFKELQKKILLGSGQLVNYTDGYSDFLHAIVQVPSSLTNRGQDFVEYLSKLRGKLENEGYILREDLKKLLESLKYQYGDLLALGGLDILDLLRLNEYNTNNQTLQLGALAKAFDGLNPTNLLAVALAMAQLAQNATLVSQIKWDVLVNSINSINTPTEGSPLSAAEILLSTINGNITLNPTDDITKEILLNEVLEREIKLIVNADGLSQLNNLTINTENNLSPLPITNFTSTVNMAKEIPADNGQIAKFADDISSVSDAASNAASSVDSAATGITSSFESIASASNNSQSAINSNADALRKIPNVASRISSAANALSNVASAVRGLPSDKKIKVSVAIDVKTSDGKSVVKGQIPDKGEYIPLSMAKGNIALAGGNQKTLMGLLGPELVVANGQYNVVGQNGAEMVDLPRDAIVFNHLQTRRLLNGRTGGHGKPVTNLHVAISLATGTVGPAFASASSALAELRKISAMWASIIGASAKDLGSMAGKLAAGDSGGGGGGGGGKDELIKASTAEIERWYNLTRQIDKLLQDITHQQTLRDKLDSDRIANGKAIYESRKLLLNNLMKQITATKELVFLQKSWYDRKRALLEASSYGKIFTYDENGLQQYTSGPGRGLDILEKLTLRDVNGKLLNNAESARKQIDYLKSIGFNIEDLKYNDDGTVIDFNNKGDKSDDDLYLEMMLNFWSAVDGWKDLLDSLYDSYRESNESILLLESNINGLLKEVVDNQRLVEDAVVKAIEDREQAIIDKLQDLRDAILEAAQKYIDGLQDSLDRLKQMYLSNQEEEDLNKLRRQILILQRTGGSGAQIGSLQNELNTKERDAYFNEQQATIDAIQQASDKELLRLDAQLDLMNDTLEYQKEHGLLWQEVTSIMSQNEEDILNFLLVNTSEYQSYSSTQMEELKLELQKQLGQWIGYRDDFSSYWQGINLQFTTVKGSIEGMDQRLWKTTDAAMIQIFGKDAWLTYADDAKEVFDQILGRTGDETKAQLLATLGADGLLRTPDGTVIGTTGTTSTGGDNDKGERGSGGGGGNSKELKTPGWDLAIKSFGENIGKGTQSVKKISPIKNLEKEFYGIDKTAPTLLAALEAKAVLIKNLLGFSSGGMVDFTGPAMLHGSKDKPLAVLNPLQTRFLREDFLSGANTLHNTLLALEAIIEGSANSTTYNSIDHGEIVTILNASVNVHVDSIANDYDASRIGDMAVERMIGIARKSGSRSVSRR